MTGAPFTIPPLPADADPDEYDFEAPTLFRSWRLRLGFDDLASLAQTVKLEVATLADIEAGVRPVRRRYLYHQLGGRLRTAAERRDRGSETTARQKIAHEEETRQTSALGTQIAAALWASQDHDDAWNILVGSVYERLTPEYWTVDRKMLALLRALEQMTLALHERAPHRDQFPYRPQLSMAEMIP